jgi:hypothetical protein
MRLNCLLVAACCVSLMAAISCSRAPKQEPLRVFKVGDQVEVGHLHYTVTEAKWFNQLSGNPNPRLPQERFLLVGLNVMNGGGDNMMLPNLSIEDDTGKAYQELTDGSNVPNWVGYLRKVMPAEVSRGTILFDAPPKVYRLRVVDENGENPALIEIPLSFGTDAATPNTKSD